MQDDSYSGGRSHQSRIVPVRLDDQTVIHIETASPSVGGSGDSLVASRIPSFDEVTDTIKSISKALIEVWQEVKPAGAIVEFGVDVAVESGHLTALLVKGSAGASLKITLQWGNAVVGG